MTFYEIGKVDGKAQYEMDQITGIIRDDELLSYTARTSSSGLVGVPLTLYMSGFTMGYLISDLKAKINAT